MSVRPEDERAAQAWVRGYRGPWADPGEDDRGVKSLSKALATARAEGAAEQRERDAETVKIGALRGWDAADVIAAIVADGRQP